MALYERFTTEAQFRDDFVKPLLSRMGFFGVAELHGQREFGKDFVFSEVTRFGLIRHSAAQVKHEEHIHQTQQAKVSVLLQQIQQAFLVPFTLADSPRLRHVSAVYVFNSGSITDGAQEVIRNALQREHYGDNVHLFDGRRLELLDRGTAYGLEREIRPRLLGLRTQIRMNLLMWGSVKEDIESDVFQEARGPILAGLEGFLSSPILPEVVSPNDVAQIWQKARIIEAICSRHRMMSAQRDVREGDKAVALQLIEEVTQHCHQVHAALERALAMLRPLA